MYSFIRGPQERWGAFTTFGNILQVSSKCWGSGPSRRVRWLLLAFLRFAAAADMDPDAADMDPAAVGESREKDLSHGSIFPVSDYRAHVKAFFISFKVTAFMSLT